MLGKRTIFQKGMSGNFIPDGISQNDLESKVCDIFLECNADIDLVNIEAYHRLKSYHWPKKVIVKLVKRKDASKILRGKKKLKSKDLSQKGFPPNIIAFINESLCSYYRYLWSKCKKLWLVQKIHRIILGLKWVHSN